MLRTLECQAAQRDTGLPASEPVSKRSHAVVIRTPTMKHDDQFAAADDLPHEGPAIISDV